MVEVEFKPLQWSPDPDVGFSVIRRPDGGMHLTFTDLSLETLLHWREFAMAHLLDSDGLTRNLYDLRQIGEIPEEAIHFAIEAYSDPSARNIRLAVLVANEAVRAGIEKIAALSTTPGGGAELRLLTNMDEAEVWLGRPLGEMV